MVCGLIATTAAMLVLFVRYFSKLFRDPHFPDSSRLDLLDSESNFSEWNYACVGENVG